MSTSRWSQALERFHDPQELLRTAIEGYLDNVYTAAPVEIVSFNERTMRARVKMSYKIRIDAGDGTQKWVPRQELPDCPVIFPSGGGFTFCAPPKPGDEALAIFAMRSIEEWKQFGGQNAQAYTGQHEMGDAFVLAGIWSKPRVLPAIDPNALEVRSNDGSIKLRMEPGGITMTAPQVTINGNVLVNGQVQASQNVIAGDIGLQNHAHGGVVRGGDFTYGPTGY